MISTPPGQCSWERCKGGPATFSCIPSIRNRESAVICGLLGSDIYSRLAYSRILDSLP